MYSGRVYPALLNVSVRTSVPVYATPVSAYVLVGFLVCNMQLKPNKLVHLVKFFLVCATYN